MIEPKAEEASRDTFGISEEETRDPDFQVVLKELMAVYKPLLEEDLGRVGDTEKLLAELHAFEPNCDTELELAQRIFAAFYTETAALALLPSEGRQVFGPPEQWRWCLLHIRCCTTFGWLVCRGPRTFRAFVYYLYRYWLCVRQVFGNAPVGRPLTAEERADFSALVQSLAGAYKPYLTDQLASIEFSSGLPDQVLSGALDCTEGEDAAAAIFERLLNLDTARALLGKEAFEAHQKDAFFWFCRCWCLCAIRFGCCLARARTLLDVVRCLVFYRRCLRECFTPIRCQLTQPTGCVEEEPRPGLGLVIAVEGTAAGAFFSHYTLEWRKVEGRDCPDDTHFTSSGVIYPGGTATGTTPVASGSLGIINTTTLAAGSYEVRVCVYSTAGARTCCCIQFNLFKRLVWIQSVASKPVRIPDGPFVSDVPIVSGNPGGIVVPVGGNVTIEGSAWVGDCEDRKINCFDLRYGFGFLPGPDDAGFNAAAYFASALTPSPLCYIPPDEADKRAPWNQVVSRALTTRLVKTTITFLGVPITLWKLQDYPFSSHAALPPCADPSHACRSGKYTLLLQVDDTGGNLYYDTQHVWFDNKPIHSEFAGLEGLKACSDLCLGQFIPKGASCAVPWPMNALGIVYDEYIDPADLSYPSDNFEFYSLVITRQGGPSYSVPITPSILAPVFSPDPISGVVDPFKGHQRVGDPGTRCEQAIGGCPPPMMPPKFASLLTQLDLRIFDATCAGSLAPPFAPPAGFALEPETCCGYTFQLYAQDRTRSDGYPDGGLHNLYSLPWAVCICNKRQCPEHEA
jgi:hypothetical protein